MNRRTLPHLFFAIFLLATATLAYIWPFAEWDALAYIGCAIALHEPNAETMHAQVYDEARNGYSEDAVDELANGSAFRHDVAGNANHFAQQLPFYRVRPIYIRLIAGLHRLGVTYVHAVQLVSALSFALFGILVFRWAAAYVSTRVAAIGSALLLVTPGSFAAARTGTPDMLSSVALLWGTYLLVERQRAVLGPVVLAASVWLRTDNSVYVGILLLWYAWARRPSVRISRALSIGLLVAVLASVLGINYAAHTYGWRILMQNTAEAITAPAETVPSFGPTGYLYTWVDVVDQTRETTFLAFIFLAGLLLLAPPTPRKFRELTGVLLAAAAARLMLFPHIEDRYFVATYGILGIAAMASLMRTLGHSHPDSRDEFAAQQIAAPIVISR